MRWRMPLHSGTRTGLAPRRLASACRALLRSRTPERIAFTVEGVGGAPADRLLWVRFPNQPFPRELSVQY